MEKTEERDDKQEERVREQEEQLYRVRPSNLVLVFLVADSRCKLIAVPFLCRRTDLPPLLLDN